MALRWSLLGLLVPIMAQAAPPVLTDIRPRGLERGKQVTLVLSGANLTPQTSLYLPFAAKQSPIADPKPNPALAKINVTVAPDVPAGIYPVQAFTDNGLSGTFLLAVDTFASVREIEDNNAPERAQRIAPPIIVDGDCPGGDVDFYRFAAKKGQRLVIETETARIGSGVVPQLRLTDDKLRFVAADDSQSNRGECRIVFNVPADGDYLLEFSDSRYRGGAPAHYRIKIGDYDVIDEVFPLGGRHGDKPLFTVRGGTLAKEIAFQRTLPQRSAAMLLNFDGLPLKPGAAAPEVALGDYPERNWEKNSGDDPRRLDIVAPITINGRLEAKGDVDRFQLAVSPGQKYRFTVQAQMLGSNLDGVLRIVDQLGRPIALVDDVNVAAIAPGQQAFTNPDPSVDVTVPEGASLLVAELRDQRRRGGINYVYRFTAEPLIPDFLLQLAAPEISVPRGGAAALTAGIVRRGYAGPIQLTSPDLPPGFAIQGGLIPTNGTTGIVTISAAPGVAATPATFTIEGTGEGLKRTAAHILVAGKDLSAPIITHTIEKLIAAPTNANAFTVQGPAALEVVKGYPTPVPVNVTRAKDTEKAVFEVTGGIVANPNEFTFTPGTIAAGANAGPFNLTIPVAGPEGPFSFVAQAKTKINNVDVTVVSPPFTINIARPFTITGPASITLPPGQMVPLRFALARKPVFKEPVTVALAGLPSGVTLAAPLPAIAADKSELVANLKVDPKVAVATATLTLSATATVNGMPFGHPPVAVSAVVGK